MLAVTTPLHRRLQHHVRLRHELAQSAVTIYRKLAPADFRIGEVTMLPYRDKFCIRETRITATYLKAVDWSDDDYEPGVAIAAFSLRLDHGRLRPRWIPSVMVSAHALARWFERTGHRDHALLVRDIVALAGAGNCGRAGTAAGRLLPSVVTIS
jgi:hypothetical protein